MTAPALPAPLVSARWLKHHRGAPGLKVLDASWHMPDAGRDPRAEFAKARIPGAHFFDIDALSDPDSSLPHMLPRTADFAVAMRALGIDRDDAVVVYDSNGLFSAPRAWWMLRVFGHPQVAVLDGGLPAWRGVDGAVETGPVDDNVMAGSVVAGHVAKRDGVDMAPANAAASDFATFSATPPDPGLLRSREEVAAALATGSAQVVDARSAERFAGRAPDPRPGVRSGHMPGALNVHYSALIDPDTECLRPPAELKQRFETAGVDLGQPLITTCGSGITACVLALALELIANRAAVYDGSWADWGGATDTTVVRDP